MHDSSTLGHHLPLVPWSDPPGNKPLVFNNSFFFSLPLPHALVSRRVSCYTEDKTFSDELPTEIPRIGGRGGYEKIFFLLLLLLLLHAGADICTRMTCYRHAGVMTGRLTTTP